MMRRSWQSSPAVPEAIPFRAPGSAPERVLGENAPNLISKPGRRTIVEAFKAQLGRYNLSHDVIGGYATAFIHDGKFVFVKTDPERAEQAKKILARLQRHARSPSRLERPSTDFVD